MTQFIYQNINIQLRIPINDDGTAGKPEVMKRFVTDMKGEWKKQKKEKPKFDSTVKKGEVYL